MSAEKSIGIVGGGITGSIVALELARSMPDARIVLYDNHQQSDSLRPEAPSHLSPVGLEVQSATLWDGAQAGAGQQYRSFAGVNDPESRLWLRALSENTERGRSLDGLTDLYVTNVTGADYYASHPILSSHVSFDGNTRLFHDSESFASAAARVEQLRDLYDEQPVVMDGAEAVRGRLPELAALNLRGVSGGILYPEDGAFTSPDVLSVVDKLLTLSGITRALTRVAEIEASQGGPKIRTKNGKIYTHDLLLLCAGSENESLAGIDPTERRTHPYIARRIGFAPVRDLALDGMTVGLDGVRAIFDQTPDGRLRASGTVIIPDRESAREPRDRDEVLQDVLSTLLRQRLTATDFRHGLGAMTIDGLPDIRAGEGGAILLVNPSGQQGFLQAPAIAEQVVGYAHTFFDSKAGELRIPQQVGSAAKPPKDQFPQEKPTPGRGSRSNFRALRAEIIRQGKANLKKPMSPEQRALRRRKRRR